MGGAVEMELTLQAMDSKPVMGRHIVRYGLTGGGTYILSYGATRSGRVEMRHNSL